MKNVTRFILMLVCAISLSSCGYNTMVEKDEAVSHAWSNVEKSISTSCRFNSQSGKYRKRICSARKRDA